MGYFLRNNFVKIYLVFSLVVISFLVSFNLWYLINPEKEKNSSAVTPEIFFTADKTVLGNEAEPEEFGNDEEPIPYGELDSQGTGMAKLSQLGSIQIKGVVVIKNDKERSLTLRIHKEDSIKVAVLPDAEWVVIYGSEETRPEDFWGSIMVGDLFQGMCIDEKCTAVDHAAVIRSGQ
jgi:hypothetical protein